MGEWYEYEYVGPYVREYEARRLRRPLPRGVSNAQGHKRFDLNDEMRSKIAFFFKEQSI